MAIALFNFFCGFFASSLLFKKAADLQKFDEELTYCHGYEDGLYYAIGEHAPDLFHIEVAQQAYREYKGLKHGPTRH